MYTIITESLKSFCLQRKPFLFKYYHMLLERNISNGDNNNKYSEREGGGEGVLICSTV